MNPIYKFTLAESGGTEQVARPVYKDDLSKNYEQESNQEFFRAKLSGKLTFVASDFQFIEESAFDTQFDVRIYISYDAGTNWTLYWSGQFWKTDCEFDDDARSCTVTPSVNDEYTNVLAGMEKEYNLIELAPVIAPVKLDKRAMIQVYIPGQTVIACFLSGMWWEQECRAVSSHSTLVNTYYFAQLEDIRSIEVTSGLASNPEVPDIYYDDAPSDPSSVPASGYLYEIANGNYKFQYRFYHPVSTSPVWREDISIIHNSTTMWRKRTDNVNDIRSIPYTVTLSPVGGGAVGDIEIYVHDIRIYARYVCDVTSAGGQSTYALPSNDLVENNRNYTRVLGYNLSNSILFNDRMSTVPTQWGLYKDGQYYAAPPVFTGVYPISRTSWGRLSIWFSFFAFDSVVEPLFRKEYTLRDAYPLSSVISVLLAQFAPGITHQGTTEYSQFLYGQNPLDGTEQTLLITPKSNLIASGYDQPAQKAPITLKKILDMLRDCYRCYWFIQDGKFRIEHISYFFRGGSYAGHPVVGRDLTTESVPRNGKEWAFATSQYKFDKPEMAARYQFGWMDDVTQLFQGYPIEILSKYVNAENIEEISISQFTSDVDYILLNPGDISKDGFVLMSAITVNGEYKLPYYTFTVGIVDYVLQNAYVSFEWLQSYYQYDMPAPEYRIHGEYYFAAGIKKLKTQTLKFPAYRDPNTLQLIKTKIGNGMIQKLSVNLSSRNANATLKYDTEQ